MDPALTGLIGTVIGAIFAFAGVAFAQFRLESRESRQEQRQAEEAALISARILQGELSWAEARVEQALDSGKYWSSRYALDIDAWLAYREKMALALDSPEEWSCVRDGYRSIRTLELQASRRRMNELDRPQVNDWGREQLKFGLERIAAAIEILAPLAKDRPREPLRRSSKSAPPEPAIEAKSD